MFGRRLYHCSSLCVLLVCGTSSTAQILLCRNPGAGPLCFMTSVKSLSIIYGLHRGKMPRLAVFPHALTEPLILVTSCQFGGLVHSKNHKKTKKHPIFFFFCFFHFLFLTVVFSVCCCLMPSVKMP